MFVQKIFFTEIYLFGEIINNNKNNNNKAAFIERDYKKMTTALYKKIEEISYSTKNNVTTKK